MFFHFQLLNLSLRAAAHGILFFVFEQLLFELQSSFLALELAHFLEHVGILHVSLSEVDVCDFVDQWIKFIWIYFVVDLREVCEFLDITFHPLGFLPHVLQLVFDNFLEVLVQNSFQNCVSSLVMHLVRQVLHSDREVSHLDTLTVESLGVVLLGVKQDFCEDYQPNHSENIEENNHHSQLVLLKFSSGEGVADLG